MFHLPFKSLTLGSMVILSTATTVLAQVQVSPLIAQRTNFSCGPHTSTYVVGISDNLEVSGIRCVTFSQGKPGSTIPRLAWYGEGSWGGSTYRHVGQAFYRGSNLVGYASDIHGNGESYNNDFGNGDLNIEIVNRSTIRITGAWNEEWKLVSAANYTPLPKAETCGTYFDEYTVSEPNGNSQGNGLRCVLRVGRRNTTWFGNGNWGNSTYSHLGTRSFNGYGANDICGDGFGSFCNTFDYGSVKLSPVTGGFNVTGAWNEKWRR